MAVAVTVEDGPVFELRLGEHLALDLAIDLSGTLLDVERVWGSASVGSHE